MSTFERLRMAAQAVRQAMPEASVWSTAESREAERLLESGKLLEAERLFLRLISDLKARSAIRPPHGHVLMCLATTQFRLNKTKDAWITADAVRELLSGPKLKPTSDLSASLDLLGRIKLEDENLEEAQEFFQKALETQKAVLPLDVPLIVERSCHLAGSLQRQGSLDEAVSVLESALERADHSLGGVHPAIADCLIAMGECESERGRHATARNYLERALKIHQELHGMESEVAVRDLHMLAVAAQGAEDLEAAIGYYEKALGLRERQLGASAVGSADILMKIATVQTDMGRYGPAMELLQQAVGKLEGARDPALTQALERLGEVYAACGRYEDADVSLRKARKLYQEDPNQYAAALQANTIMLARLQTYLPPPDRRGLVDGQPYEQELYDSGILTGLPPAAYVPPSSDLSALSAAMVRSAPVAATESLAAPPAAAASYAPAPARGPAVPENIEQPVNIWREPPQQQPVFANPDPAAVRTAPAQKPKGLHGWDQLSFEYVRLG